jgi:hypothetical protein
MGIFTSQVFTDLLDEPEIKRKHLELDQAIKHRVELPGEVSVFLFVASG